MAMVIGIANPVQVSGFRDVHGIVHETLQQARAANAKAALTQLCCRLVENMDQNVTNTITPSDISDFISDNVDDFIGVLEEIKS